MLGTQPISWRDSTPNMNLPSRHQLLNIQSNQSMMGFQAICNCWWCAETNMKNYYRGLCHGCTQILAKRIVPIGQVKYDLYFEYWDALKTLVQDFKLEPGELLFKSMYQAENKDALNVDQIHKAYLLKIYSFNVMVFVPPSDNS